MKKQLCFECGKKMTLSEGVYESGITYSCYKCPKCNDTILTMDQLHNLAVKERTARTVKISQWGSALAIRIPKQIAKAYKINSGNNVTIIPEKRGFKIIPSR